MLVRYFKKAKYFHVIRVFSPIIGLVLLVLKVESVKQSENSKKFVAVFSVDGAFVSATSEVPDIGAQNSTNDDDKGHKSKIFGQKITSGNSEAAFFRGSESTGLLLSEMVLEKEVWNTIFFFS